MASFRALAAIPTCIGLLSLAAVVMLAASLLTLFRARRFCAETLAPPACRACLWLMGVTLDIHQPEPLPPGQTVYLVNHTSTLDLFIVMAMGLPRTRFFMKRRFLLVWPIGLIAVLLGTFFTPPQTDRSKRVACFQRAERILRKTGDSVFLSPEGTRVTTGEIGPFNKGAFHLATNLGAPIVPLFIDIPPDINPGRGILTRPGRVTVRVKPAIATTDWVLADLLANKQRVRQQYVGFLAQSRAITRTPSP